MRINPPPDARNPAPQTRPRDRPAQTAILRFPGNTEGRLYDPRRWNPRPEPVGPDCDD
jgi:hypothetical protein